MNNGKLYTLLTLAPCECIFKISEERDREKEKKRR